MPLVVVSQGRVVVQGGQVTVVRGCGRFIPRRPFADLVYSRTLQRDKVSAHLCLPPPLILLPCRCASLRRLSESRIQALSSSCLHSDWL